MGLPHKSTSIWNEICIGVLDGADFDSVGTESVAVARDDDGGETAFAFVELKVIAF